MMIAMLIAFTIGGQNFERYEPMPNLATCWLRAPERMNALLSARKSRVLSTVGPPGFREGFKAELGSSARLPSLLDIHLAAGLGRSRLNQNADGP
jgi:hypothetical protein